MPKPAEAQRSRTRTADVPPAYDADEGERRARLAKISRDMPKGGGRYAGDSRRY